MILRIRGKILLVLQVIAPNPLSGKWEGQIGRPHVRGKRYPTRQKHGFNRMVQLSNLKHMSDFRENAIR